MFIFDIAVHGVRLILNTLVQGRTTEENNNNLQCDMMTIVLLLPLTTQHFFYVYKLYTGQMNNQTNEDISDKDDWSISVKYLH